MKWYEQAIFYEIYIPSFKDGNNDGVGDLLGIISKLDYLKDLGVTGIWLTPIYPSPKIDNGYDISDYVSVDSAYGTLQDFDELIKQAHQRGIKVIMDLVLNHTSDQHEWFQQARLSKDSAYYDYYIWRNEIPNNWESFFAGSAWEYNEITNSYYYHAFAPQQVDLNWTNPKVKEEMFNVIAFWLARGVDGFRLDVINFLKTDLSAFQLDNPFDERGKQIHQYDKDQINTLKVIKELRQFINQYEDKYLLGEVGSDILDELLMYVGDELLHSVFNFNLGSIDKLDVSKIVDQIQKMENENLYPTLFFTSHDMSRYMSRLCQNDELLAKVIATMMLSLKGIPFIYQGDELGMNDLVCDRIENMNDVQGILTYEEALKRGESKSHALDEANKNCRDKSRSPIHWTADEYGGFSDVKPWLSLAPQVSLINVEKQQQDEFSMLSMYQTLIRLRSQYEAFYGDYSSIVQDDETVLIHRYFGTQQIYIILCFEDQYELDLTSLNVKELLFSSVNRDSYGQVMMLSKEALIFLLEGEE